MRASRSLVLATLLALPALSLAPTGSRSAVTDSPVEVARIRAHFDSVLAELAARDLRALTAAQRANRNGLVTTLAAYRERGVFPHNYDFAGQAVPYFVDRKTGTLCAVAHLLERTGRRDIVDRVARADNNVWVAELAGDAEFESWLDANGVTLQEAARIQVPYVGPEPRPMPSGPPPQSASSRQLERAAPIVGVGALAAGIWNAYGNADGRRRSGAVLGLASGLAMTGVGVAMLSRSDASPTGGAMSALVGTVGVTVATRTLFNRHRAFAATREADKARADDVQTTVTPLVSAGNGGSAGVSVSIRF
jgi:hypothetical protein